MKREIEFRGKRIYGYGKWVYGHYYEHDGVSYICNENHADSSDSYYNDNIHPETLGQYTGLKDKNGVKIFSGDKVLIEGKPYHSSPETPIVVEWGKRSNGWILKVPYLKEIKYYKLPVSSKIQVIGNIHENG